MCNGMNEGLRGRPYLPKESRAVMLSLHVQARQLAANILSELTWLCRQAVQTRKKELVNLKKPENLGIIFAVGNIAFPLNVGKPLIFTALGVVRVSGKYTN